MACNNVVHSFLLLPIDWNMHFKPGPYPLTEAERVAAANKYNMLPEEYVPYADDG